MHEERAEWAKDVFPQHASIISLSPFKNKKHFQVLLELYTSWETPAMVNCPEILQRSVICAILPVQDMQVLELKQNSAILTDWVLLHSSADRATTNRSQKIPFCSSHAENDLKGFLIVVYRTKRLSEFTCFQEHMALTEQVQATETHYLDSHASGHLCQLQNSRLLALCNYAALKFFGYGMYLTKFSFARDIWSGKLTSCLLCPRVLQ